jgi:hypothetical protein
MKTYFRIKYRFYDTLTRLSNELKAIPFYLRYNFKQQCTYKPLNMRCFFTPTCKISGFDFNNVRPWAFVGTAFYVITGVQSPIVGCARTRLKHVFLQLF